MVRDTAGMRVEQLEQIAALVVTAGLVAGNLLLFSPWRRDQGPGERLRHRSEGPAMLRSQPSPVGPQSCGAGPCDPVLWEQALGS